jgi:hypothetical protein
MQRKTKLLILINLVLCSSLSMSQAFGQNASGSLYNSPAPVTQTPATSSPAPSTTTANSTTTTPSQVVNNPDGTQSTIQSLICPLPSALIKNGLFWGTATGDWKSYSESFDSSISSFMGAQWVGINVGKMVCIYKGNLATSFPITIQNDTLSQAPTGSKWGTDQGGFRNCHSANVQDCPFIVKTQSVNIQQIYKTLDFFKGKPNPLQQQN